MVFVELLLYLFHLRPILNITTKALKLLFCVLFIHDRFLLAAFLLHIQTVVN